MESNEKTIRYEEDLKPETMSQNNNSNQNLIESKIDSSSSGVINSASMSDNNNSNSLKVMNEAIGMEIDKLEE